MSLPVPTLDGWLAGCGVDAVELPAKTKTEKKVVAAPIAAAMGSESDAMLRQSDEDALGAVRRDDCSTMDTAGAARFSSSTAEAAASASAEAAVVAAAEESALQSTLVSVSAARDALRETKERLEAVQGSAEEIEWARHSLDAIASSHNGNGAAQLVNAQLLMQSSRWAADAIEMEHRVAQRSVEGALGLASESDEAAIRALFAPLEEQHSLVFHGGRQPVGSKVTEEARAATITATAAELRTF